MTGVRPGPDPLFLELQEAVAGRYSLDRELGRGGMGIVYLARDVSLDRLVALKLLHPDLAARPALRERFLREARTAGRLSHPNIVPVHSVEEAGRLVWFVMAYVRGETLGARLRQRGALPPGEIAPILRDLAWALGYAHGERVVHRDVKPDNILLEAGGRRALLTDFGIAAPERGEPLEQGVAGTVAYLSPEQARGDALDGRSDLYALGVVGYVAAAARLPYPTTDLAGLIQLQLAGAAPALAEVAPHVPRAFCRAIDRCLSAYPSARFQTAEELAGALEQLTAGPTELPAPLRVWLTRGNQARTALVLWSLLWSAPLLGTLVAFVAGEGGWIGGLLLSLVTTAFIPWAIYLGARVGHTRKVLAAGYTPNDLVLALRTQAERHREELAFEIGKPPSQAGRVLRKTTIGVFAASIATTFLLLLVGSGALRPILMWAWIALTGLSVVGVLTGMAVPGREMPAARRAFSLRERFWTGPMGRLMIRLAGSRLGSRAAPDDALHRPTEVALGQAAEALFRALPPSQRRDLAGLPAQLEFLTGQAQGMRQKLEELDDLIVRAAPDTLFGDDAPRGDGGAAALTEARTLWAQRLRETVALLESLRLGLLKLHAGAAVPETLTADLEAARDLKERLGLLVQGQSEIDHLLGGTRAPS